MTKKTVQSSSKLVVFFFSSRVTTKLNCIAYPNEVMNIVYTFFLTSLLIQDGCECQPTVPFVGNRFLSNITDLG